MAERRTRSRSITRSKAYGAILNSQGAMVIPDEGLRGLGTWRGKHACAQVSLSTVRDTADGREAYPKQEHQWTAGVRSDTKQPRCRRRPAVLLHLNCALLEKGVNLLYEKALLCVSFKVTKLFGGIQ